MRVITDENLYNELWDKVYDIIVFKPRCEGGEPISSKKMNGKLYSLNKFWNENQERIINNIFISLCTDEMYAMEWQGDAFIFNPNENIPYGLNRYDSKRACNVYFPSYYPDGDYYFYIAKDFSYGMFGHPWRKEIFVFGDTLISKIDENQEELELGIR